MAAKPQRTSPTWSDVKAKLGDFDRAALFGLLQDMYASSKDNQRFLHTRFALGADALAPYKAAISRWVSPDVFKNHQISVATAKRAIADYRKAAGEPLGLAELMVFYCERAAGFARDYGMDDEGYYDALIRMFEQALRASASLPEAQRGAMLDRLNQVQAICRDFGYGVYDTMDDLLDRHEAT